MAVIFDTSTRGSAPSISTSVTISHTCTGASLFLLTAIVTESTDGGSSDSITGVTYNGVALTQLKKVAPPAVGNVNDTVYLYGLLAPATGTHDIVVSSNGDQNGGIFVNSASYSGVLQSLPSGSDIVSGTNSSSTTLTLSALTPSVPNSWVAFTVDNMFGDTTLTSSGTFRNSAGVHNIGDTNTAVLSYAAAFSAGASTNWGGISVMLAPSDQPGGAFIFNLL